MQQLSKRVGSLVLAGLLLSGSMFLSQDASATEQSRVVAQQTSSPGLLGRTPLRAPQENAPAPADAAQERIAQLEASLAFEREVNDELMKARPGGGSDRAQAELPELTRRLERAGRDFDSALAELRSLSAR